MIRRCIFYFVSLWIIVFGIVDIVHAVPVVTYNNSYDSGSNLWTYDATIFNDTPDILYDFVIYPIAQPLSGADQTGIGWGPADVGNTAPYFVHWMADFGAEILPGYSLGGFWFTYSGDAAGDIGPLSYTVLWGWDAVNDALYTFDGSTIPSSSPIPEPGTLALMAVGVIGVGITRFLNKFPQGILRIRSRTFPNS